MRWVAPAAALVAAGVVAVRRRWLVVTVVGTSMTPALHPGDVVLARRSDPAQLTVGDVVVLAPPDGDSAPPGRRPRPGHPWLVKRVAAGPGEPLPYEPSGVVPPRTVAVLGDNGGDDSRTFGPVPHDRVLGVVLRRVTAGPRALPGTGSGGPEGAFAQRPPDGTLEAMGLVVAAAERVVHAPPDRVRAALRDYSGSRSRVLPAQFSEYRVEAGGQGAGSRVRWKLAATRRRVREQVVLVSELPDGSLVESDANSSMVTTWAVYHAEAGAASVLVWSTWQGTRGIGGFFERTFAPKALRRIYEDLLDRLDRELAAT